MEFLNEWQIQKMGDPMKAIFSFLVSLITIFNFDCASLDVDELENPLIEYH